MPPQHPDNGDSPSKASKAWNWAVTHWDTLVTLVAAAVFALLDLTGAVSDDVVRAGTLAVLALIAFTLIRLRSAREDTQSQVQNIVDSLNGVSSAVDRLQIGVSALDSGAPWRVLYNHVTWDLETRDVAHLVKKRRLHFCRNDVLALHDWFAGDGTSENERATPGKFVREPTQRVQDREYSLIFLPHPYDRGDEETFEISRVIRGGFPRESEENVSVDVLEETERVSIKVIWPTDKPPKRVWTQGKQIGVHSIALADLADEAGGRRSFSYELKDPQIGDNVYIYWDW